MSKRPSTTLAALVVAGWLAAPAPAPAGAKWEKVDPSDPAFAKPAVDPEAGAEVLLWRIEVEDEIDRSTILSSGATSIRSSVSHFLRTKVFDERGVEAAGKPEIVFDEGTFILDFAARTVRGDGTVVEVARSDRFERTVVKADGVKRRAVTFAFPSVAPGAILEYRWTERRYDNLEAVTLLLQRDLPVRVRELRVSPLPLGQTEWRFQMRCFGMAVPVFEEDRDGYQRAVLPPIRGRRDEPHMPPEFQAVPWATLYYTKDDKPDLGAMWKDFAQDRAEAYSNRIKVDDTVKRTAAEAIAGATDETERLDRLAEWCRESIENWNEDRLGTPARDPEKAPRNRTPAETLARKGGMANDIVCLFVALCRGAGFDAHVALTADRSEIFFDSRLGVKGFLDNPIAVVRTGDRLRFYDPGIRWIRGEGLAWWEDGQEALILARERAEFIQAPMTPPDSTRYVRTAHLRLAPDGGLEGSVRIEFHGGAAAAEREYLDDLTPDERVKRIRDRYLPGAEELMTPNAVFENLERTDRPLVATCGVRLPRYATIAGSRFLAPVAFFQSDHRATFPSDERHHPIYFHFPWCDDDTVEFEFPEGYSVEGMPDLPPLVAKGVGAYRSSFSVAVDGRSARYRRSFRFGEGDAVYFPQSQYAALKKFFDEVLERDRTVVSLRRTEGAAETAPTSPNPESR